MTCSSTSAYLSSSSVALKADGVREQHLLRLVQLQAAGGGVQRVEQAVVGRDLRAREGVQQRALAGVRIADDGHHGHGVALAAAALDGAHLAHLFQLFAQFLYLAADVPPVGLQLGLAGASGADGRGAAGGRLAHQVRPHARQVRQQIFVLRELHLQLALARARALGEDVKYQPAAVEHAHAQLLAEDAHLAGRELVVKNGELAVRVGDELLQLGHLALADEGARVGRGALLQHGAHALAAGGLHQRGQLLHGYLARALGRGHARRREAGQDGAFFFLRGIVDSFHPAKSMSAPRTAPGGHSRSS